MKFQRIASAAVAFAVGIAALASQADFTGWWSTKIAGLPVVVHITEADNALKAELYSPHQSATAIPIESAKAIGDTLRLKSRKLNATFKGVKDAKGISGTFKQGGLKFVVTLSAATEADARIDRPQTPVPPYQYRTREVALPIGADTLHGTLTLPQAGPVAGAVVFITGSGTQDRDETIVGHKPFAVIADFLTRAGWATLRCDDRGVHSSRHVTYSDLASDVDTQRRYLASLPELDGKPLGLLGHSQGGSIAFMAAAAQPDSVAFAVTIGAPGVKGSELMVMQNKMLAGAFFTPALEEKVTTVMNLLASDRESNEIRPEIMQLAAGLTAPAAREKMVESMLAPSYRELVKFNPKPWMKRVQCPVLAINGENDAQVSATQNLPAIASAIPSATVKSYPGINHLMQPCARPTIDYASNPVTIDPQVLKDIYAFLLKNFPQ